MVFRDSRTSLASWANTACIAAPRSPSGATRSAACAACTTAGNSTSRATCSTCLRRRRARRRAWARRPRLIRRAKAAASSGSGWARSRRCGEFEPPAWAPKPDIRYAIVKMHAACNWAQVLEGSIDSAHSSSLHSTNMPAAEVEGSTATESTWLRPSTDKAPRLQFEATELRLPLRRDPQADPQPRDPPVRPHHALYRAVHLPHPAERPVQPGADAHPVDDVNTMFYWIAWHPDPKKGISQQAWRRFCAAEVGVDLDETFGRSAICRTATCKTARP